MADDDGREPDLVVPVGLDWRFGWCVLMQCMYVVHSVVVCGIFLATFLPAAAAAGAICLSIL